MTHNPLSAFAAMLKEAAATSSKNDKQAAVGRYILGDDAQAKSIRVLLNLTFSPYITFGIKKLPKAIPGAFGPTADAGSRYQMALSTFDALATRSITGGAAANLVAETLGALPEDEADAFTKILLRDLKAGFSESTVNKVVKGCVPVFSCQLAPSELAVPEELTMPQAAEIKYDGVRTVARKRNGVITLLSRNGLPFENFEEVERALAAMPEEYVLDGEVVTDDFDIHGNPRTKTESFSAVMKRAGGDRGKNIDLVPNLYFRVFDIIPVADWDALKCPMPYLERRALLADVLGTRSWAVEFEGRKGDVTMSPHTVCVTADEVAAFYEEQVAAGYEGIMVKSVNSLYTFKRNAQWQKIKPFENADMKITDIIEGAGEAVGSVGCFMTEGMVGDTMVKSRVGPGNITKMQAKDVWQRRADHMGMIIESKFQGLTLAEGAEFHALRFGTFVRFRSVESNPGQKI